MIFALRCDHYEPSLPRLVQHGPLPLDRRRRVLREKMVAEINIPRRISPTEAAKLLGRGKDFIMSLFKAGEIVMADERRPGAKIPRWTIDPRDLEDWQRRAAAHSCFRGGDGKRRGQCGRKILELWTKCKRVGVFDKPPRAVRGETVGVMLSTNISAHLPRRMAKDHINGPLVRPIVNKRSERGAQAREWQAGFCPPAPGNPIPHSLPADLSPRC
jgi:hypothetical protein